MTECVLEMSRYIDIDEYHKHESNHPFYREMVEQLLLLLKKQRKEVGNLRILEFGAGTGLFTKRILSSFKDITINALELDAVCISILNRSFLDDVVKVIHGDICTFRGDEPYDVVVSTFAHDHIDFGRGRELSYSIFDNLKPGGIYLSGLEILPYFESEEERKRALYIYHNFIIERALSAGHDKVALLEQKALESGLNKIGDFKRHRTMFEEEMNDAGFSISFVENIGPVDHSPNSGVYVYEFSK